MTVIELAPARQIALRVAWSYLGTWYRWGGDDPGGFDCSGLIVEVGQSAGWLPRDHDFTAEALRVWLPEILPAQALPGDLVFWMQGGHATHVGLLIDPPTYYIGAEGGGSGVTNAEEAARRNAFIKVRLVASRGREIDRRYASPYQED